MSSNYKKRVKADETFAEGGYKNQFWFAPVADFLSIKTPGVWAALGDKVKITLAHTFGEDDGFIAWRGKKHAVTTTAETTGEDGSKSLLHKGRIIVLGDGASTLEQMRDLLNDDIIILVKDQDCLNAGDYVQFGDECLSPDLTITFDGKTTKEGLKEYTVEWSVKDKKFFYSGAVTEKPEA